jgi:hypothetical protein
MTAVERTMTSAQLAQAIATAIKAASDAGMSNEHILEVLTHFVGLMEAGDD